MEQPTKLLLDADILLFQSTISCEYESQWDDGVWTLVSDTNDAIYVLEDTIYTFEEDTGIAIQDMVFCLSDTKNFRYDVASTYKWNRKNTRKPICYNSVKEFLIDNYETKSLPNLEGDDVIGLLMDDESALWSRDKDLKQIAGLHWNGDDWDLVSDEEADRFFLYQCLAGDSADGYGGCPGIGPVKANAILDKNPTWEAVVAAYESKKLTLEDALEVARQARILRPGEYDYEKQYPILWSPI